MRSLAIGLAITGALAASAQARPIHGSVAAGGALVLTGSNGDRLRNELSVDVKWRSRYGAIVGWRAFDAGSLGDGDHAGLLTAGLVYEAGAARPRLVLDLVAEVGVDLDAAAPVVGAGLRNTLGIIGPLALVLHTSLYVVIDGGDSRAQLQTNLLVGARW